MIDQAEQWLRQRGLRMLRVRYRKGDMARIEVPLEDLPRLADSEIRAELCAGVPRLLIQICHSRPRRGSGRGVLNALIPVELC